MKRCSNCRIQKELDQFTKNRAQKDGLHNECKECKKRHKRTRDQRRVEHIRLTYGLSPQDYLGLLEEQGNKCCICNKGLKAWSKTTHVDHCHESGHVRGILCRDCNLSLGHYEKMKKNDILSNFEKYLGE